MGGRSIAAAPSRTSAALTAVLGELERAGLEGAHGARARDVEHACALGEEVHPHAGAQVRGALVQHPARGGRWRGRRPPHRRKQRSSLMARPLVTTLNGDVTGQQHRRADARVKL